MNGILILSPVEFTSSKIAGTLLCLSLEHNIEFGCDGKKWTGASKLCSDSDEYACITNFLTSYAYASCTQFSRYEDASTRNAFVPLPLRANVQSSRCIHFFFGKSNKGTQQSLRNQRLI